MSSFPQQGPQSGYAPPANYQGQQQQQGPQLQRVMLGQGYAPGQFPHMNECHMIGQIFPNQWMPNGIEYKATDKGGTASINVKIRNAWGDQPDKVKIQFIRLVAFGALAQQLMNMLKAGQIIEFKGEFRPNKYKNRNSGKIMSVNQIILSARNNEPLPIRVLGELPMYDEVNPNQQQGWGNGGNNGGNGGNQWGQQGNQQQTGTWGAPPAQPPQQPYSQPGYAPPQGAPMGGPPSQMTPIAPPPGGFQPGPMMAPPQGGGFQPMNGGAPVGGPPTGYAPPVAAPQPVSGTFPPPGGMVGGPPMGMPPGGAPPVFQPTNAPRW